mgnify:CR=1 FL=1
MDEAFAAGTAAAITPIHRIQRVRFGRKNTSLQKHGEPSSFDGVNQEKNIFKRGKITQILFKELCKAKRGEDPEFNEEWVTEVPISDSMGA